MYAQGVLEELSVGETNTPLNLKYLINTWGGHKLRLRFRRPNGQWAKHRDLNLYSFPPLVYGTPVPREVSPHVQNQKQDGFPQPPYYPPPPPAQNSQKEMLELMALMQKMRSDDLNALGALWQAHRQESPPPPPPQPQYDPIRMLQGAFGLFAQFQQLRAPQPEAGENDEILGLLGKAVDVFAQNRAPTQDSRITPPSSSSSSSSSSIPTHLQLAQMEPAQAIATLKEAAAQMDPDKQAQLMGGLLGSIEEIGGTDILLDQLEQRGILPEYEDDEEPDSEDDSAPYPGRESGSDEGNGSNGRTGH